MLHAPQRKLNLHAFCLLQAASQYVPRTVEIAQALCAEWAQAGHIKGSDEMKAFTFQVHDQVHMAASHGCGQLATPQNLPGA